MGEYRRLFQLSRRLSGLQKLTVFFKGPGWLPEGACSFQLFVVFDASNGKKN
jgi:hypothetical protein